MRMAGEHEEVLLLASSLIYMYISKQANETKSKKEPESLHTIYPVDHITEQRHTHSISNATLHARKAKSKDPEQRTKQREEVHTADVLWLQRETYCDISNCKMSSLL